MSQQVDNQITFDTNKYWMNFQMLKQTIEKVLY